MATCNDCLHVDICEHYAKTLNQKLAQYCNIQIPFEKEKPHSEPCEFFKDRSRFVELPDVGDYDTVTTIDEAIDHCYQIVTSTDESVCVECKAEHMRLCGWLGDLKRRIIAEQALKERENNVQPERRLY